MPEGKMRVRVTLEYDYEDPDAYDPGTEAKHWREGNIDCPTLDDGNGSNLTVKVEQIETATA